MGRAFLLRKLHLYVWQRSGADKDSVSEPKVEPESQFRNVSIVGENLQNIIQVVS